MNCTKPAAFGPEADSAALYSVRNWSEEPDMNSIYRLNPKRQSLSEAIQARISAYLYEAYTVDDGLLGDLDRWTQRRITDENMAKLALVLESDDPAETCYRDLIREIDTEAESGIFLVEADAAEDHLKTVAADPGVSGDLHKHIAHIAPVVLPDEAARSNEDLDLVWIAIRAYHDRAHVDATVSEIILSHLMDDATAPHEMTTAMRALQYAYHEDFVRRQSGLPRVIDDRETRDLMIMVTELARRAGSYDDRTEAIRERAQTF